MALLKCEGLSKEYGTGENWVIALKDISFAVDQGEFVAITGPSGSGKSTLLHILGTVDCPTSGSVQINGVDISVMSKKESAIFRRREVGLIYQFYNLVPTLTVEKNITLPLELDKKKADHEYFQELVHSLGIEDRLQAMPNQLSGGQQQRVAIARSLIYRPSVLLADEPTGNLDRKNGDEVMKMLKWANENLNQTILLVTHDDRIAQMAKRRIVMEDGMIVEDRKQEEN